MIFDNARARAGLMQLPSTTFHLAAVMTQVGADVFVDFATTDILLVNTTLASVAADDFMFL